MARRLLLILTEFPPSFGGMQSHAMALSQWLHDRGYHVEVATYRLEDGPVQIPQLAFPVHRILSRVAYQANVQRLSALAREMQADLVYSSTVYYGNVSQQIPVLCRSAGNDVLRPWIAWPFRFGCLLLDQPWVERQLYRRWKRWQWPTSLESLLLQHRKAQMIASAQRMQRIFANSDFTRDLLEGIEVPPSRIVTLPGGVDAAFFAPPSCDPARLRHCEGTLVLLTACRLVAKKGLDLLLEAVRRLKNRFAVELWIAGDGRERNGLAQSIADWNLSDTVRLLGYVPPPELRDLMHAADVFVLSSQEVVDRRTGLRDAETMGRVLCEAAACGLPAIASRCGGIPSVVEHDVTGLLVHPGSVESLCEAIMALQQDADRRRRYGLAARRRAEQSFGWPTVFAAHEVAIEAALTESELNRGQDLAGLAIKGLADGKEAFERGQVRSTLNR